MINNIIKSLAEMASFIYGVKHVSNSQWDVENIHQVETIYNHDKRQLR